VRRQALASIDQKNHAIGLKDRLAGLTRHLGGNSLSGHRFEAAAVDHYEFALADPTAAILAITRKTRHIGDQGGTRPREPIE
jgi:hypothetical protein